MYEIEREELVNILKEKGVKDDKVLSAIRNVGRHFFVPEAVRSHSYNDVALPIGYGQTISQPYTVAVMTEALKLSPVAKVLEIGTGSGYQAAILLKMGMKVYTIERNDSIHYRTQKLFDKMGLRILMRLGDGTIGWEDNAPFDGIIVTAGSPTIPEKLKKQLSINGRLVIPVGDRYTQSLTILTKISDTEFKIDKIPQFTFVPLIGKEGWKEK